MAHRARFELATPRFVVGCSLILCLTWQHIQPKIIPTGLALRALPFNMVVHDITWQHTRFRCHGVAIAGIAMTETYTDTPAAPKKEKAEAKEGEPQRPTAEVAVA